MTFETSPPFTLSCASSLSEKSTGWRNARQRLGEEQGRGFLAFSYVVLRPFTLQYPTDSPLLPPQGKRYMLPNTTMMLHHPSGVARGQASDIQVRMREWRRRRVCAQ